PPSSTIQMIDEGLIFQASLSFLASVTGAQVHKMPQSACFAHIAQYIHVGAVDSVRAKNGSGHIQLMSTGRYRALAKWATTRWADLKTIS
ncbi:MAG: hypothetical protein ABGY30_09850, partial [Acidimicrobiales bacterium]